LKISPSFFVGPHSSFFFFILPQLEIDAYPRVDGADGGEEEGAIEGWRGASSPFYTVLVGYIVNFSKCILFVNL
jgi:hypothetical protein